MPLFARRVTTILTVTVWSAAAGSTYTNVSTLVAGGDRVDAAISLAMVIAAAILFSVAATLLSPGWRVRRAAVAAGSRKLYYEAERLIAAMPVGQVRRTDDHTALLRVRGGR